MLLDVDLAPVVPLGFFFGGIVLGTPLASWQYPLCPLRQSFVEGSDDLPAVCKDWLCGAWLSLSLVASCSPAATSGMAQPVCLLVVWGSPEKRCTAKGKGWCWVGRGPWCRCTAQSFGGPEMRCLPLLDLHVIFLLCK